MPATAPIDLQLADPDHAARKAVYLKYYDAVWRQVMGAPPGERVGLVVDPAHPDGLRLAERLAAQEPDPARSRAVLDAFRAGVVTCALPAAQALAVLRDVDPGLMKAVLRARAGGAEVVAVGGAGGYSLFTGQRVDPPPPARRPWPWRRLALLALALAALGGWGHWRAGWSRAVAEEAHSRFQTARAVEGGCRRAAETCRLLDVPPRSREHMAAHFEGRRRAHQAEADRLLAEWGLRWRYLRLAAG